MNDRKIAVLVRRRFGKDSIIFLILKYCHRVLLKIEKVTRPAIIRIIRQFDKNWCVKNVELEITYRCNKLCRNCSRHCSLVRLPYLKDTDMTTEQVNKFIDQVKQKNIQLDTIHVLGGEPFLHPGLNDIIYDLFYKLMIPGNVLRILIWTNGIIDPENALKNCRQDSRINRAFNKGRIWVVVSPEGKEKTFMYVLWAPVDLGIKWNICDMPRDCGILINKYGYWPGSACGPIALLFNRTEYARYDFPERFRETWPDIKKDICKCCVAGCRELVNKREGYVSASYKKAIRAWMRGEYSVPREF